ncbi:MAG: hypothetical protein KJ915_08150 [Candidatus Omnitrophica bacterium]|nr:hypothetical protein [Candidatus Omnitrophota bacterium]
MLKNSHRVIVLLVLQTFLYPNVLSFGYLNTDFGTLSPKLSVSQQSVQTIFKHIDFDRISFSDDNLPGLVRLNPGWIEYFVDKKIYPHRFTGIIRPNAKRNTLQLTPEFWLMKQEFEAINEPGKAPYLHFMELDNIHFSVVPWLQKTFPQEYNELSQKLTDNDLFWYYVQDFYQRLETIDPFKISVEGLWWGEGHEQRIALRGFEAMDAIRQISDAWDLPPQKNLLYAGFIQIQKELPKEISDKVYTVFSKYKHTPLMEFTVKDMTLAAITNNVLEGDKTVMDIPLGRKNIPILREKGSLLNQIYFNKANSLSIPTSI